MDENYKTVTGAFIKQIFQNIKNSLANQRTSANADYQRDSKQQATYNGETLQATMTKDAKFYFYKVYVCIVTVA